MKCYLLSADTAQAVRNFIEDLSEDDHPYKFELLALLPTAEFDARDLAALLRPRTTRHLPPGAGYSLDDIERCLEGLRCS